MQVQLISKHVGRVGGSTLPPRMSSTSSPGIFRGKITPPPKTRANTSRTPCGVRRTPHARTVAHLLCTATMPTDVSGVVVTPMHAFYFATAVLVGTMALALAEATESGLTVYFIGVGHGLAISMLPSAWRKATAATPTAAEAASSRGRSRVGNRSPAVPKSPLKPAITMTVDDFESLRKKTPVSRSRRSTSPSGARRSPRSPAPKQVVDV